MDINIVDYEPVLEVNDLKSTIEYYTKVLGFNLDWTWPEDGKVEHASVSLGDAEHSNDKKHIHIQLSQSHSKVSNSGWLYIRIGSGVDELYNHYREHEVKIVQELDNYPWQMREFTIEEINGHKFRFAFNYLHKD